MIDVDKTYDPTAKSVKDPSQLMSLDEHREIEFAKIQQPGFGIPKVSPSADTDPFESDNDEVTP